MMHTPLFLSEQLQETRMEEKSTMNFVLMVRKGHKQQYKSLAVPINSELALNLKNREEVRAWLYLQLMFHISLYFHERYTEYQIYFIQDLLKCYTVVEYYKFTKQSEIYVLRLKFFLRFGGSPTVVWFNIVVMHPTYILEVYQEY